METQAGESGDIVYIETIADVWSFFDYSKTVESAVIQQDVDLMFDDSGKDDSEDKSEARYRHTQDILSELLDSPEMVEPGKYVNVVKLVLTLNDWTDPLSHKLLVQLWTKYRNAIEKGLDEMRDQVFKDSQEAFAGLVVDGAIHARLHRIIAADFERAVHLLNQDDFEERSSNLIIKGAPGLGKTEIARRIGQFIADLPWRTDAEFVEVRRADLVAEYVGHTESKTNEVIFRASQGALFIDEAHEMIDGGSASFAKQALEAIGVAAENRRGEMVIIFAGYPDKLQDLLDSQPGLASRFPHVISLEGYTDDQLKAIRDFLVESRTESFGLTDDDLNKFDEHLRLARSDPNFGQARWVRSWVESRLDTNRSQLFSGAEPLGKYLVGPPGTRPAPPTPKERKSRQRRR